MPTRVVLREPPPNDEEDPPRHRPYSVAPNVRGGAENDGHDDSFHDAEDALGVGLDPKGSNKDNGDVCTANPPSHRFWLHPWRWTQSKPPSPHSGDDGSGGAVGHSPSSHRNGRRIKHRRNHMNEFQCRHREHLSATEMKSFTDISASPRLVGYMYMAISGLVCAISAAQFKRIGVPGVIVSPRPENLPETYPAAEAGDGGARRKRGRSILSAEWGMRRLFSKREGLLPVATTAEEANLDGYDYDGGFSVEMTEAIFPGMATDDVFLRSLQDTPTTAAPSIDVVSPSTSPSFSTSPSMMPTTSAAPTRTQMPSATPSVSSFPTSSTSPSATTAPSISPTGTANETISATTAPSLSPHLPQARPPLENTTSATPTSLPTLNVSSVPSSVPTSEPTTIVQVWLNAVEEWKMWGAIVIPAFASLIGLIVIFIHFDKRCFPQTWYSLFRDGSTGERNLLLSLFALWIGILYVNTSSNSVGNVQANVYFSSWIGFFSVTLTYGLWRNGASRTSILAVLRHHPRLTTYNWACLAVFSFSLLMIMVELRFEVVNSERITAMTKLSNISQSEWIFIFVAPGITTGLAICAPLLSHWTCRQGTRKWVRVTWHVIEGLLLFCLTGLWSYSLLTFTGVTGIVNGINNPYMFTWGTFLCTLLGLGTWFRQGSGLSAVIRS